ncbi:MAG TPA: phosphoribosylformylglycinamidine cyclo-ligase [Nitrososphaerales archaeon]|nr:phosphoribosylformylglycinamidine cyclo-ligase [Nitrososphaerales archaeon]
MKAAKATELSYEKTGVNRKIRRKSQIEIQGVLNRQAQKYPFGRPAKLPFGNLFPASKSLEYFYDLQIEGVGTKTLLAELAQKYDTIGIDGVAMAVNDVIRSGAHPVLISDGIHIARSDPEILDSIVRGVQSGAKDAECTLASGETGDVREILHEKLSEASLPFDLFVSCLGIAQKSEIITGQISRGDQIVGLESSGIHSNGLSLARRVLLRKWGGVYDPHDVPEELGRPVIEELLEPTRIYVQALKKLKMAGLHPKATLHVTGDGLEKFRRLLDWRANNNSLGIALKLSRKPPIFELTMKAAGLLGSPIPAAEMFRTFNMGVGFALIFSRRDSEKAVDCLNNEFQAEKIGFVSDTRKISIQSPFSDKPVIL